MTLLLAIDSLPHNFTSPCTYPSEVKHPPQKHTTRDTPHHPFPSLNPEAPYSSIPPHPSKSQLRTIYRSASADTSMGADGKDKNFLAQARSYKISRPMALKPWRRAPPVQNVGERSSKKARVFGKKSSMGSLRTAATHNNPPNAAISAIPGPSCTSSSTSLLPATMGSDSAEDIKEPSAPFDWEVDLDPKDTFIEKNRWRIRSNTKLHPYALEEAPYMQSYGSTPLRSDYYTDILLQRLLPSGSPTFHDYSKQRSPASVLDLGCGPGHWILYAAGVWKGSTITGLDLVDVTLPEVATTENIQFRRGNFVEYGLPFPEKSFELVRMANLALCIPYDKWPRLLVEVRRVLTPCGRLELIDDQVFFPYGSPPTHGQSGDNLYAPVDFDLEVDGFDEADEISDSDEWADANSTFMSDRDSVHSSSNDAQVISPAATLTQNNPNETPLPTPTVQPEESELSIWASRAASSRHLETIFERMLGEKYGMHPRPSEFILDLLEDIFGTGRTKKMNSYHLKIAPFDPSVNEEVVDTKDGLGPSLASNLGLSKAKEMWKANKRDRKRRRKRQKAVRACNGELSFPDVDLPDPSVITPKLAELLGIAYTGAPICDIPPPATLNAKAAARLGIPYSAIPISRNTSSDSESSGDRSSLEGPPLPPKDARYLETGPIVPCSPSTDTSSSRSCGSSSERSSLDTPATQSPVLSMKAADRLGISYSDLAAAASDPSLVPSLPIKNTFQPSGLLLWPKTYIPLSPDELEMHCTKHIHLLLGCKHGLIEFMTAHLDEHGERIASDDEIYDCLWDYECFRRTRFNWPLGSLHHSENEWESDHFIPSSSSSLGVPEQTSNHSRNLSDASIEIIHSMDLNHVRSIHVFEARRFDGILD